MTTSKLRVVGKGGEQSQRPQLMRLPRRQMKTGSMSVRSEDGASSVAGAACVLEHWFVW